MIASTPSAIPRAPVGERFVQPALPKLSTVHRVRVERVSWGDFATFRLPCWWISRIFDVSRTPCRPPWTHLPVARAWFGLAVMQQLPRTGTHHAQASERSPG